jgi:succinate dehydrogenase / fumarate reductase cytochrome b subunit
MPHLIASKRLYRTNYDRHGSIPKTLLPALRTTVGSKFLVALTGLALAGFVIAHMTGNLLVFKGRDALNSYALFLKDRGALLWVLRIGLLVAFVLHIALAVRLTVRNHAARPQRYVHEDTVQATIASRTMIWSGLALLAFVIFHLLHYTFGAVFATAPDGTNFLNLTESPTQSSAHDPARRHDVYAMTIYGFRNVPVSIIYIIAQLFLGLHLWHGIGSTFQSLGWNSPRWNPVIAAIGRTLAVVLTIGNISMPLAIMARFIGNDL